MGSMSTTPIAITGVTGFVGRHIVDRALEIEQPILGLGRANGGPDLVDASVADWASAFEGAQVAIHLAALLPWTAKEAGESGIHAANVEGAIRVMKGFVEGGGRHLIFLSTIGVNGYTTKSGEIFKSDDRPNPDSDYARSKLEAERKLAALAKELDVAVTVVRPPLVYGPTTEGSFGSLVGLVRRAPILPLGGLNNHRDLVGVRNLADCLLALAMEAPTENLRTFLVSDRSPLSTTQLVSLIGEAVGKKSSLISLPRFLQRCAMAFPPTRGIAARLYGDIALDTEDLAEACSWRPRFTPSEEIARLGE